LGDLDGVGQFLNVSQAAESISIFNIPCRVASLNVIIQSKRAAARPKDLSALPELEALKELKDAQKRQKNKN
jgi:hypothetical protein